MLKIIFLAQSRLLRAGVRQSAFRALAPFKEQIHLDGEDNCIGSSSTSSRVEVRVVKINSNLAILECPSSWLCFAQPLARFPQIWGGEMVSVEWTAFVVAC